MDIIVGKTIISLSVTFHSTVISQNKATAEESGLKEEDTDQWNIRSLTTGGPRGDHRVLVCGLTENLLKGHFRQNITVPKYMKDQDFVIKLFGLIRSIFAYDKCVHFIKKCSIYVVDVYIFESKLLWYVIY